MKLRIALLCAALTAASASAADLTFTPLKSGSIYATGEKAGWTVTPAKGVTDYYAYTIRLNGGKELSIGIVDPTKGPFELTTTLDQPGMIYVTIDKVAEPKPGQPSPEDAAQISAAIKTALGKKDAAVKAIFDKYPDLCLTGEPCAAPPPPPANLPPLQAHFAVLGAAVEPTKLQPTAPRPADFDVFWAGKLAALAKVKFNPVLTEIAAPVAGVKLYKIKLDSLNSHVQGYLAVPVKKGKFPAMIQYQWAGVYKLDPSICANRAAAGWLCLNVSSHDMAPDTAEGAPKNYYEVGNTSRETSYFLNMYLRDTQALNWLRTHKSWNNKTLVVTGTSMGGHQSLITAGLNPGKVTAVLVNEPSGADSNGALAGRMAAYPNWAVSDAKVAETALYFDTVNFASKINAPVMAAIGFIDSVCPPATIFTAVNQIPVPHEIIAMTESEHNNHSPEKQAGWQQRSEDVLATILHGGTFVPNTAVSGK